MEHSATKQNWLKKMFKYVSLYITLLKYALQTELMYPKNFITGIIVELFYQLAYIAMFGVMFTKTQTIGGWDINQMLILLGIDTITAELLVGMVIIFNTRFLPEKIWHGELDFVLLKPVSSLFIISLGKPYFPSFISTFGGIILLIIGLAKSAIMPSFLGIIGAVIFFICGFIIIYSITITVSLITFFFQDASQIPKIGEYLVLNFTGRPHTIYSGFLKFVFFFIVPVVYVSSFSTDSLINGVNMLYLITAIILSALFLWILNIVWKKALQSYSSVNS